MFNFFKQKPTTNYQTVTLKIKGMHCTSCALNIDGALEDEVPGVASSQTNYAKSTTTVEFDPQQTTIDQITSKINQVGYQIID